LNRYITCIETKNWDMIDRRINITWTDTLHVLKLSKVSLIPLIWSSWTDTLHVLKPLLETVLISLQKTWTDTLHVLKHILGWFLSKCTRLEQIHYMYWNVYQSCDSTCYGFLNRYITCIETNKDSSIKYFISLEQIHYMYWNPNEIRAYEDENGLEQIHYMYWNKKIYIL